MGSTRINVEGFFSLLKKLAETPSPSGFEGRIRELIIGELKPYADELYTDAMGNLIAVKHGKGSSRLMVAAHMDEIGLIVNHITKEGFIKFLPIGGWADRILPAQRVQILTKDRNIVKGVIGVKPPHIMKKEEADKVIPMKDLFIDIGASSREEVRKLGIDVGSPIVMDRDVCRLGNGNIVTGRAFDNKVGVAVMIEFFKSLGETDVSVYAVATVQEEVGLKGARTASFAINPNIGIALDTTVASDTPGVPEPEQVTKIGKGPAIKVMDGRGGSGLISHPEVRELLVKTAEENSIPYQLEILPGGTTDAAVIQLAREGVPAATISIPTRYIHSPTETLSLDDAVNAVKLLVKFTERLTDEWVKENLGKRIK